MLIQRDAVVLTVYDHEPRYAEMFGWLKARVPVCHVTDQRSGWTIGFLAVFPRKDDPALVAFREEFSA